MPRARGRGTGILGALAATERGTRNAATNTPTLVLAAKAGASGDLLARLLDAYAAEPGAVAVDLLLCESQPQTALCDGRADVALLHQPFDSTADLDTEALGNEGQVVILPRSHPFAVKTRVRTTDVSSLPDLPLARWPGPDGTYPGGPGPEIRILTQVFQLVAVGRTTVIMPESSRPGLLESLTAVPVADAPIVTTVIAWPPHSRSRTVASLVRAAAKL